MGALDDNKCGGLVNLFTYGSLVRSFWRVFAVCVAAAVIAFLQACAQANRQAGDQSTGTGLALPSDFFLDKKAFAGPASIGTSQSTVSNAGDALGLATTAKAVTSVPRIPMVWLYASPSSQGYFASGNLNYKVSTGVWEVFLQKYAIPFTVIRSVEALEAVEPGVLLLPSSVALSDREKRAVLGFRAKGGGLLGSWLSGVRGERGEWQGWDFMARALDVAVVGTTESEEDETFLMPYGDSPVTHSLQAGVRIWLERVKGWYPLRLIGDHPSARMMDWSRTPGSGKPSSIVAFDERKQSTGLWSRSVALGYSERMWLSADPKLLEAIAHNALLWLLRQPDAYLSAWPHPFSSAAVVAIEGTENFGPVDLEFARKMEDAGAKATYFVASDNVSKSLGIVKSLQSRGHEIAYFGDRFEGFRDQSQAIQARRLTSMRQTFQRSGVPVSANAGFRAPMDAYDKTTQKLLTEMGFGYHVAFMDGTDSRLPFLAAHPAESPSVPMVVLPRTQQGPEEALESGDPDDGLKSYFEQLDISLKMGGLSVISVPNQSLLTPEQVDELSKYLKNQRARTWLPTAAQVAQWWHARERIGIRLEPGVRAPELAVNIRGQVPLGAAAFIWINLPARGDTLRLVGKNGAAQVPKVVAVDGWRSAILLEQLPVGDHRWELYFDGSN